MQAVAKPKVKHIRNYLKVRKMILAYYAKERKDAEEEIARIRKEGMPEGSWQKPEDRIARLEEFLRPPVKQKNGKLKYLKDTYAYWEKEKLDRLEAADKAGVVTEITCKIEWKKSHTWGWCPVCETWVQYDGEPQDKLTFETGSSCMISTHHNPRTYASGCGYDKKSTVVSEGIQCPAIDRLVIEHEKCWKEYAVDGKNCFPHLSFGGKGMSTFQSLFKAYGTKPPIPGFDWEWAEGKTWDYIHVKRKM